MIKDKEDGTFLSKQDKLEDIKKLVDLNMKSQNPRKFVSPIFTQNLEKIVKTGKKDPLWSNIAAIVDREKDRLTFPIYLAIAMEMYENRTAIVEHVQGTKDEIFHQKITREAAFEAIAIAAAIDDFMLNESSTDADTAFTSYQPLRDPCQYSTSKDLLPLIDACIGDAAKRKIKSGITVSKAGIKTNPLATSGNPYYFITSKLEIDLSEAFQPREAAPTFEDSDSELELDLSEALQPREAAPTFETSDYGKAITKERARVLELMRKGREATIVDSALRTMKPREKAFTQDGIEFLLDKALNLVINKMANKPNKGELGETDFSFNDFDTVILNDILDANPDLRGELDSFTEKSFVGKTGSATGVFVEGDNLVKLVKALVNLTRTLATLGEEHSEAPIVYEKKLPVFDQSLYASAISEELEEFLDNAKEIYANTPQTQASSNKEFTDENAKIFVHNLKSNRTLADQLATFLTQAPSENYPKDFRTALKIAIETQNVALSERGEFCTYSTVNKGRNATNPSESPQFSQEPLYDKANYPAVTALREEGDLMAKKGSGSEKGVEEVLYEDLAFVGGGVAAASQVAANPDKALLNTLKQAITESKILEQTENNHAAITNRLSAVTNAYCSDNNSKAVNKLEGPELYIARALLSATKDTSEKKDVASINHILGKAAEMAGQKLTEGAYAAIDYKEMAARTYPKTVVAESEAAGLQQSQAQGHTPK